MSPRLPRRARVPGNRMRPLAASLLFLGGLCIAAAAPAASFDCAHAAHPDERAVCNDRALNDRDVRMALLYDLDRKFLAMGGRGLLMDEQAAWLRSRHACGASRSCLVRVYDRRIADLRHFIDTRVATHGPF